MTENEAKKCEKCQADLVEGQEHVCAKEAPVEESTEAATQESTEEAPVEESKEGE